MLSYGIILGILSIVLSALNYAFGDPYQPHWSLNLISGILMVVTIVLGIKKVKSSNNGYLTFGEALKTGIGIALISGLIFVLYFYVFAKVIEPEYVNNITEINIEKALEMKPDTPQEALDMQEKMTKKYFFVFTFGAILIFNVFIGFVVSLISGLVMQKKEEY